MLHLRLFTVPFNLEVRAEHVGWQGRARPCFPSRSTSPASSQELLLQLSGGVSLCSSGGGSTEEDIKLANSADLLSLRDPQPDAEQVKNPEWLVVGRRLHSFGLHSSTQCRGQFGGWFRPCHGSHYDISGRIRKGPAPFNLEVPTYSFLDENKLPIG